MDGIIIGSMLAAFVCTLSALIAIAIAGVYQNDEN